MRAPMTPGTQPQMVSRTTNKKEPHPLSITAKGGKKMHKSALRSPIVTYRCYIYMIDEQVHINLT